jgi:RNA polymerase sigma-70 factor (sigma-E family)
MMSSWVSRADDQTFTDFVNLRSSHLTARAVLLCGEVHTAHDLVQSVLVRVYPRWRKIEHDDPIGYVNRALDNAVIDHWRSARRRREVTTATLPEEEAPTDGSFEDRQVLLTALVELTARERSVVVLRYLDDLTERQTAERLGVSVGTVKSTCHRALKKLRVTLDDPLDERTSATTIVGVI